MYFKSNRLITVLTMRETSLTIHCPRMLLSWSRPRAMPNSSVRWEQGWEELLVHSKKWSNKQGLLPSKEGSFLGWTSHYNSEFCHLDTWSVPGSELFIAMQFLMNTSVVYEHLHSSLSPSSSWWLCGGILSFQKNLDLINKDTGSYGEAIIKPLV